jgi:2-iminobutanoate/2-iminopropanoate deaminase
VKPISTDQAPAAIGPYSQAINAHGFIYTAGQVALDPASGKIVEGGIAAQTQRVLDNLTAVLASGGATWADVVKTTVYLADLADFQVMNELYGKHLGAARPARSTVQVAALPRNALVEIDAIAYVKG